MKSRVDQLSLQVRSLQYQLLSVNEKLLRKEASYSRQMTRPLPSSEDINSHPVRDDHVKSVGSRGNHSGKSTPINRNPHADLSKPRTPLVRPGQNIPIFLPIIQILYSQFISLLFNLMSPIIQIQFHIIHCRFISIVWYNQ